MIGSVMIFASFWQTDWIRKYILFRLNWEIYTVLEYNMHESPAITNKTSLTEDFLLIIMYELEEQIDRYIGPWPV